MNKDQLVLVIKDLAFKHCGYTLRNIELLDFEELIFITSIMSQHYGMKKYLADSGAPNWRECVEDLMKRDIEEPVLGKLQEGDNGKTK